MWKGFLAGGLLVAVLCAAPAADAAKPIVGMGDQKPQMFEDPRLRWLDVRHARLVVPWYVETARGDPFERAHLAEWLTEARRHGVQPLVGFGHGFYGAMRTYLPTRGEYRRAFRAFRKRWPWVRTIIPWNEANHCSQPTCKRPRRTAQYYDAAVDLCRRCTVTAPAVIDQPNMVEWLRRFERAARHRPRIYALHNYLDVNRLSASRTRRLLRSVKGRIWITETGGVVSRKHYRAQAAFPESPEHAGRVTRFLLDLATKLSSRVERVYLYHWNTNRPEPHWDSGLIDWFGLPRPGFDVVAAYAGRNPRLAPHPKLEVPSVPLPPPPPPPSPPPPSGQSQPPPEQQQPPPEEPPPSEGEEEPQQRPPREPTLLCTIVDPCPALTWGR